jgi:hypothetical protein
VSGHPEVMGEYPVGVLSEEIEIPAACSLEDGES